MGKSYEEQTEDHIKKTFAQNNTKYYTKTEDINGEIRKALSGAVSKSGGTGSNYPDIKLFIETKSLRRIPVMIEVKGAKGLLIKKGDDISNTKKDGSADYKSISRYAVNGAVHYCISILNGSTYTETIAAGFNGYLDDSGSEIFESRMYYISKDNLFVPKEIPSESGNLSLLYEKNADLLARKIDALSLSDADREKIAKDSENAIETNLKHLNQLMQDDLGISVGSRVELVTGMIMAGLGVPGKVASLEVEDLKGMAGSSSNDGRIFLSRISDFLSEKELPEDKRELIINDLSRVFLNAGLCDASSGESRLRKVYREIKANIIPYVNPERSTYLDFTGKLFNVLTEWVDIPDGGENDVVLTPRYVTDMMAKLCCVDKDSYVWDYAAGTAGFLVSSMKLMLADAERIGDIGEKEQKKKDIRAKQLLGIEKRPDIYLLAVLNMILMGDGTSNIIQGDSLKDFDGNYAQGELKGTKYPATVTLINPPYSGHTKGAVFMEKALERMDHGRAALLIQENAGSGNGLPSTKNILKRNTLIASIHMADIFKGKAGVQTAIYVFEVGKPHDPEREVIFIDMSDDGYLRRNRKKASAATNLKDTGDAAGRYAEVVDIVLGRRKKTDHYKDGEQVFRDVIGLDGNDWTLNQHKKYDTVPTEEDFRKTIADYLSWRVSIALQQEVNSE